VLRSFADKDTERVWRRERSHRLDQHTQWAALRKLLILDAAETLDDATIPPGNRLEKLRGDRAGQYSIRVNQQWRICFRWTAAGHVPPRRINEIVHGKRRISADTALRLARYFGTSERFWMNLQGRYDLEVERDRLASVLDEIHPRASA
jgi:toxin HigB-1